MTFTIPSFPAIAPGWKTVIVNVAIAAFGSLAAVHWADLMPSHPAVVAMIISGIGAVNILLRAGTNTTIFADTSPAPTPAGEPIKLKMADGSIATLPPVVQK